MHKLYIIILTNISEWSLRYSLASASTSSFNFLDRRYANEQESPENRIRGQQFLEKDKRVVADEQSRISKKGAGVVDHHHQN